MATVSQIKANVPANDLHVTYIGTQTDPISFWQSKSISFNVTKPWFITVYSYFYYDSSLNANANRIVPSWTANPTPMSALYPNVDSSQYRTYAVWVWTATFTGSWRDNTSITSQSFRVELDSHIYFW